MTAEEKKYRILGIILAAVTYAVIIVAMILTRISASSEQNSQINASENKTQIAFDGEEYVEFGDIPEPNLDDGEPAANDADNEQATEATRPTKATRATERRSCRRATTRRWKLRRKRKPGRQPPS